VDDGELAAVRGLQPDAVVIGFGVFRADQDHEVRQGPGFRLPVGVPCAGPGIPVDEVDGDGIRARRNRRGRVAGCRQVVFLAAGQRGGLACCADPDQELECPSPPMLMGTSLPARTFSVMSSCRAARLPRSGSR
jgi:hypothetical protein